MQKDLSIPGRRPAWEWLFLIEGVIAIGVGLLIVLFLPKFPDKTKKSWLLSEEDLQVARQGCQGLRAIALYWCYQYVLIPFRIQSSGRKDVSAVASQGKPGRPKDILLRLCFSRKRDYGSVRRRLPPHDRQVLRLQLRPRTALHRHPVRLRFPLDDRNRHPLRPIPKQGLLHPRLSGLMRRWPRDPTRHHKQAGRHSRRLSAGPRRIPRGSVTDRVGPDQLLRLHETCDVVGCGYVLRPRLQHARIADLYHAASLRQGPCHPSRPCGVGYGHDRLRAALDALPEQEAGART